MNSLLEIKEAGLEIKKLALIKGGSGLGSSSNSEPSAGSLKPCFLTRGQYLKLLENLGHSLIAISISSIEQQAPIKPTV